MAQPNFIHAPDGIKIVFNEVHKTNADEENFTGEPPAHGIEEDSPRYGSLVYKPSNKSGLFTFQTGVQPWGADVLDWINVWRVIPYIQLGTITNFKITIVPPENRAGLSNYPEAQWVSSLTDYTNSLMEKLLHLSNPLLILRPGSQLKIVTAGATVPQMVEVWWERARQIRPNETGSEVFAYGV